MRALARVCLLVALAAWPVAPASAEAPVAASRFGISIDGVQIAQFAEGAVNLKTSPPTVVLKRATTDSRQLRSWHDAGRGGRAAGRKAALLVEYDRRGKPVARYHLEDAWPSVVRGGKGAARIESVTIVCEHLQRVAP